MSNACGNLYPGSTSKPQQWPLTTGLNALFYLSLPLREFYTRNLIFFFFSGCALIDPGASTGVIYNDRFPFDYGGQLCIWYITAPSGMMINLTFTKFDLSPRWPDLSGFCDRYVELKDSNLYRRKLCGSLAPFSMYFTGSISVTSHARFSSTGGFLAFYQIRAGSLPTTPYGLDHYTLQRTFVTPASLSDACRPYSQNSKFYYLTPPTKLFQCTLMFV